MNLQNTANPIVKASPQPGVDLHWPASAIWRPGEPAVRPIGVSDLKDAVAKGFDDFKAMPSHAIFLIIAYPIIGIILFRLAFGYNTLPLVFPMLAGFALLGPVAALGLYELSRRRELGLSPTLSDGWSVVHSPAIGRILTLGAVLLAIFFAWLTIAQALYMSLFQGVVPATGREFLRQIVTTDAGHTLILAGNTIGFLFAAVVLMISTVSFPMLLDRDVSTATAVRTSVRAFFESPVTMALWGLFVALALFAGAVPFFLGLAIVLPVLGHATWHLYRKVVER